MSGERHARARARERYGIDLEAEDAAIRCRKGEGIMQRLPNGKSLHALVIGGRVVWLVYLPPEAGSREKHGSVLTALPPGCANKRVQHDVEHARRRTRK